ncbi:hypothetical protein [Paraburkholderia solisilvae]|uniref:Uncharacterized protein n=1 Tax=Paraburkholderia solisilvae TaxID=624376 RepID=A0A6J5DP14_9BURK|nr:hypothetical protein [Paraburkholderia solisilvae]CAB3755768.1 hypothetical protein LMG29739_02288 [Paraburkholderia solisilvae]
MSHVLSRIVETFPLSLSDTGDSVEQRIKSLEHRRASLTQELSALEALVKTLSRGSLKYQSAKERIVQIQNELRVLKGRLGLVKKNQNLGDFLIQIFKERLTNAEWDGVVAEARRRCDLQGRVSP